jgi:ABC-type nickel/cobalt efflux system permease component RcnA
LIEIMVLGFVIGLGHALEADHLAALSTIVVRERRRDRIISHGVSWGLGHALMLLIVGGTAVLLQTSLDERLAGGLEAVVGVMLVVLGARVLWRLVRDRIHIHRHRHDDGTHHLHAHSHRDDQGGHDPKHHSHGHIGRLSPGALAIGLVHGMAGSAALVVLAATVLASPAQGLAYVAIFGLGSVLGMGLLSAIIAVPLAWTAKGLTIIHQTVQSAVALGAITIGCMTIWEHGPSLIGA